jgi:hypothetical protein
MPVGTMVGSIGRTFGGCPKIKDFCYKRQAGNCIVTTEARIQYVAIEKLHHTRCTSLPGPKMSPASGGDRRSAAAAQQNAFCAKGLVDTGDDPAASPARGFTLIAEPSAAR